MRPARLVIIALSTVIASVFPQQAAGGCSCMARTPQEKFASAKMVFTGDAVAADDPDWLPYASWTRWTFRVEKREKGPPLRTVRILGEDPAYDVNDNCSNHPFQVGGTYRVFAYEHGGRLHASIGMCSSTEVIALPARRPEHAPNQKRSTSVAAIGAALAAAAASAAFVLWRRKRALPPRPP